MNHQPSTLSAAALLLFAGCTFAALDGTDDGAPTLPSMTSVDPTSDTALAAQDAIDLGTAAGYVILSKAGITTVPTSTITGNLGCSPAAASYITGFSLIADPSNTFSTSSQVSGRVYAADYAIGTPAQLTLAVGDMEAAYERAAMRAPDVTGLGGGSIGGRTIIPGVYRWNGALAIPTDVTLAGPANGVWIFQVVGDVEIAAAAVVRLTGGAQPRNVVWQVAGSITLGANAHLEGTVLTQTFVTLGTGAGITGRVLAQTHVTIAGSTIVQPAP